MQVIVKRTDLLSTKEYKACHSLNMRQKGMMQFRLQHCRKNNRGWVFMIWDNDKLMSWALVFNRYYEETGAYFYTRISARGKGYGSAILAEVKKFNDKVICFPWNNNSDRFFSKRDVGKDYGNWRIGESRYIA